LREVAVAIASASVLVDWPVNQTRPVGHALVDMAARAAADGILGGHAQAVYYPRLAPYKTGRRGLEIWGIEAV